jgi:crotonobetainyl-CoA:carnitine CoA-transferase CaiB-like acyl-CoA transferase
MDATVKLPLSGIRVLDLTAVWAGPHATMLLADWGAEVIRVESIQFVQPNTRGHLVKVPKEMPRLRKGWQVAYPDWDPGERPWNRYPLFQSHARNKLSVTVDLLRPEGLEVFHRLVSIADVFVENNVPETIEKLHLTYEELSRIRPDLIMLRMPAYGLSGPYKNYRSFGMQLEGTAGHTGLRGYTDTDPTAADEVYMGDAAGGVNGAFAVMLALRHRRRTGQGQLIELPQVENFMPYLGEAIMDYTMNGRVQGRLGNRHPSMAPHGVYRCRGEDRWVTIAAAGDEEWRGLCRAMGNPAWAREPRFRNGLARWKHQDDLDRFIGQWTEGQSPAEVMMVLQANGVAAGVVQDDSDLYADAQLNDQVFFKEFVHADAGTHRYPGLMWKAEETPNEMRTPPVRLGEYNEFVYRELMGVSGEEYGRLEETGHIGTVYASHLP